jgi:glycosyltransferase involved in cell wall biosynthesis
VSRLSILHVLAPTDAGGLETVVRSLAVGQRDNGHTVRVVAVVNPAAPASPVVTSLDEAGVEVLTLAIRDRAYLREGGFIADLCRRHDPTVVHTHGFRPDVLDATVARYLGVPTITTVHGFTGGGWRLALYERLQRLAFRRFDAVAAVSRPLADRLAADGVPRDRIHVVPNAYTSTTRLLDRAAARRALFLPEDRFVVGWVGRLSREKGPDVMIDAVARLATLPMSVSVLGAGPEREALGARAIERGVGGRITWHGVVRDAAAVFRAFDVLVLSSRTEGCPIVLLEAMAAGVPIVATTVGGVPDVVTGVEASLVPPEDPASLADAIRDVARDRQQATARARAAHARLVAEFQPGPWVERYDSLYRRIQRPGARNVA